MNAIGQYAILRALSPGRTFLAQGIGQPVVIKWIEGDCLVDGRLHPNIRDRLARVRELAHIGVANLHGVERDGERAFAVWEYVPGLTLESYAAQLDSPAALARLAREALLAVEAMHALGIVHGKIHARNLIVDHLGVLHLTHVSPLLYDDPMVDARDVTTMLDAIAAQRGWPDSPSDGAQSAAVPQSAGEKTPRRLAISGAVVAVLAAAALAMGLVRLSRRATPQKPLPPQAPPAAFDSP